MQPGLVSHVGIEFENSNEAWTFWLSYGGQKALMSRKGIQTKDHPMVRLHHADLFV
jgi:predicted RNA-binding protein with PUA domain